MKAARAKTNGAQPLVRAVLYLRTSTERQAERVSPEAQLADCQSYALSRSYTVTAVYQDTERYRVRGRLVEPSGTRADRPQFARLIADGQAGLYDVIVAWREDRLYRGIKPAVIVDDLIESHGVTVELVKETFDRRMLFLKASIARIELDGISERTAMGKRGRVQRGLHHGGRVPRGYTAIKDVFGRTTGYALLPEWRPFFADLARLFLERIPYHDLPLRLAPNPATGRPWDASTLRFFLLNPFYRGQLAYNWRAGEPEFVVPGVQPPAWDGETIAALDRELARRHHNHWGPRGTGPWSGILRCGICGLPMSSGRTKPIPLKGGGAAVYRGYFCNRPRWVRQGKWPGPAHAPNYINERKLMGLVREAFAVLTPADVDEWLAGQGLPDDGAQDRAERLARAQAEAARLESKLADLSVGLEGVRHASPAAAEVLIAELRRAGQALDGRRAEIAELSRQSRGAPDLANLRAGMLALIDNSALFDRSPDDLAPDLRAALSAIYVLDGRLVPPVAPWPRPEWRAPAQKRTAR